MGELSDPRLSSLGKQLDDHLMGNAITSLVDAEMLDEKAGSLGPVTETDVRHAYDQVADNMALLSEAKQKSALDMVTIAQMIRFADPEL